MHKVVPTIQKRISIQSFILLMRHCSGAQKDNVRKVALLGTKYTMTEDFYKDRIRQNGIDIIVPAAEDIEIVNSVIYDELCLGIINDASRKEFVRIIESLKSVGAEAVILGCTEIGLLIKQEDSLLPVYDTTQIHGRVASLTAIQS
jgi:aspartate racemase